MKALQYVEIDVPFCALTYGTAPCGARITSSYDPIPAGFDGATTYLKRAGGLTGAADSKLLTVSCWLRLADSAGGAIVNADTALNGTTTRTAAGLTTTSFFLLGYNAAGTQILGIQSSALPVGPWVHILASVDLSNSSKRHLYVNDVSDLSVVSYTNDTIDFTMADWGIGATAGGTSKFHGSIADLWFAPGVYLDLSNATNRRKFIDSSGNPVSLGATGNTPTGTAPLLFLSDLLASWHTNKGTGGGFTKTGTLTEDVFGSGTIKCFNSRATCQSTANFVSDDVTLRFAKPAEYLPHEIEAIPSVSDIAFTPATVSLGENLGTRATLSVTFIDHRHSDTGTGFDKYLGERDYDPYSQGTFWGKFRARQPYLRGQPMRWIAGLLGDDLADMESRMFIIDSFDGPSPDGKYTILAKDVLKLADGDRSQAPVMSNGYLAADITAVATSASLLPSGIGNLEYPAGSATSYLCIGGNEIVQYTRSGDTLTIARGALGTTAAAHKADDRVQVVLRYVGADAADILDDLFTTYAGISSSYITLADWTDETTNFLGNLYTATIPEPTSVATLAAELIEQAGLVVWWDDVDAQIRLQVLRALLTNVNTFTPENTLQGTLTIHEQPTRRLSRVQVYFAPINPTRPLNNLDNFRAASLIIDEEGETNYGSAAIKTIYSRWIPQAGKTIADRLGAILIGRFGIPPRRLTLSLPRYADVDPELGTGYRVEAQSIQDATGAQADIPIQITRLNPYPDRFVLEAEEMLFNADPVDLNSRVIVISANSANINLRTQYNTIYPAPKAGDVVTCTISAGVTVSSASTAVVAFDVGSWPTGVTINLVVVGKIVGAGGAGGSGASVLAGSPGGQGGPALRSTYPVNVDTSSGGRIWGGGGGGGGGSGSTSSLSPGSYFGGGGGGGGGAGEVGGAGGGGGSGGTFLSGSIVQTPGGGGAVGTSTGAGAGGTPGYGTDVAPGSGGFGGGMGLAGAAGGGATGGGGAGGIAGHAIDGIAFVTLTLGAGDIRGPQV